MWMHTCLLLALCAVSSAFVQQAARSDSFSQRTKLPRCSRITAAVRNKPPLRMVAQQNHFRDISKQAYVSEQQQFNFTYSAPPERRRLADEVYYTQPCITAALLIIKEGKHMTLFATVLMTHKEWRHAAAVMTLVLCWRHDNNTVI
jgi:hypothetical protein